MEQGRRDIQGQRLMPLTVKATPERQHGQWLVAPSVIQPGQACAGKVAHAHRSVKVTQKCPKVEGVGCWLRLCWVAGYASEARLLDATAGVTTGGALSGGCLRNCLGCLGLLQGHAGQIQATLVGAGHNDTAYCSP